MKELVPMNDYGKYKALVQKSYKLVDEIDTDWCDKTFEILQELDELADCATSSYADIRNKAREVFHEIALRFGVNCLDFCFTVSSIYRDFQDCIYERDICEYFEKNCSNFLGSEWHIVERHNKPEHKPDFWVSNGVEDIPVECKRFDFDKKAKEQLMRYMNVYHSEHGIAVGMELKCELPDNIRFIQINLNNVEKTNA